LPRRDDRKSLNTVLVGRSINGFVRFLTDFFIAGPGHHAAASERTEKGGSAPDAHYPSHGRSIVPDLAIPGNRTQDIHKPSTL
jgi:hypothetical protein